MKRIWIFICLGLAIACAVLAAFFSLSPAGSGKILLVQDPLDPLPGVLEPLLPEDNIQFLNPYQLGYRLPGLNGTAFAFGPQVRHYQELSASLDYTPLSTATVVIAVNRGGNSTASISGWQTLLDSEAVVLLPGPATEGGRLAAIALARGLGAAEGDLMPALDAFASLQSQGRLNHQDEYKSRDYRNMVPLKNMLQYDAILLWDYQAAMLARISGNWDLVVPEEGTLSVDWGFVSGGEAKAEGNIPAVKEFLLSEGGRQVLSRAGFSPLAGEADLLAWERARFIYNPRFRRAVLAVKLHSPASVQERLLLQSVILLLFCVAAQQILKRIPHDIFRRTSLYSILFVSLWMLIGIAKTLSLDSDPARYFWFATYISRHFFPVCWFCMCYAHRYNRLPARKTIILLISMAVLLTLLVFTNDAHRLVFFYRDADPWSWTRSYINAPGYYLSVLWSFALGLAGFIMLIYKTGTRRQKRLMLYATVFFAVLLTYQVLYVAGVEKIIDLDISTTVAISVLVFNLAAQRERFMRASLLELPIFNNSPYAIAVYDATGQAVYANAALEALGDGGGAPLKYGSALHETGEISSGKQVFKPYLYTLDTGKALVLEDITHYKQLEKSLQETHQKLKSVQRLLIHHAGETRHLTNRVEQDRYAAQMEQLFEEKLEEARRQLQRISGAPGGKDSALLRRARFLLCICQQRLGFVIRNLGIHPLLPLELIERYVAGIMKDGRRFGLDGVVTAAPGGFCSPRIVAALLEAVDSVLLYAFDYPGLSLICRLDAGKAGVTFNTLFAWEESDPDISWLGKNILSQNLVQDIGRLGGQIFQKIEEDGMRVCFFLPHGEVRG